MSSPFQPYRPRAATAAAPPAPRVQAATPIPAAELAKLRASTVRFSRSFAVTNAVFAVAVLLASTAGGLLGTEVVGRLNLGMLLALAQVILLLGTSAWFDRRSAKVCDRDAARLVDGARTQAAGRHGHGAADSTGWPAQPYGGQPAHTQTYGQQAEHPVQQQAPSYDQLYATWDSYLYAGNRPDARPSDPGTVGR